MILIASLKGPLNHAAASGSSANQHTGTSIAMIERAYMRLIPAALQEKLAAEA